MEKNIVIETLEKIVGTDKISFISGEILDVGTDNCHLNNERGSVYGIAIKITDDNDKETIFDSIADINRRISKKDDWKTIGDNFYPLYWGKDINMGIRLHSHTKAMSSTGTLQLNKVSATFLNHTIIYGALPCVNYKENEKKLHSRYIDLMRTKKSNEKDELNMSEVNEDEN